jgi:hypothetical protein
MPIEDLHEMPDWSFFESSKNLDEVLLSQNPLYIDNIDLSKEVEIFCTKRGDLDGDVISGAGSRQSYKDIVVSSEQSIFHKGLVNSIYLNMDHQYHAAQMDIYLPDVEHIHIDNPNVISFYKNNILRLIYSNVGSDEEKGVKITFSPKRSISFEELILADNDFPSLVFNKEGRFKIHLLKNGKGFVSDGLEFSINPNPSAGRSLIQLGRMNDYGNTNKVKEFKLYVYDPVGRVVLKEAYHNIGLDRIFPIAIKEDLPKGHYTISINVDDRIYNLKYVKL